MRRRGAPSANSARSGVRRRNYRGVDQTKVTPGRTCTVTHDALGNLFSDIPSAGHANTPLATSSVAQNRREQQSRCGVDELKRTDPEIYQLIKDEERYEIDSVRLIASENYVSKAVLEATGSILTNKYSEGYPGRRYYEGQRNIDQIETLAVNRAKALFKRRARQRAAVLGLARKRRGLFRAAQAGRHDHGPLAAAWRTSDPRMAGEHHGHVLEVGAVRGGSRESASSISTRSARLARKERPKIIVTGGTAYPRLVGLQELQRNRKGSRRAAAGRHLTCRGTDRRRRASGSRCRTPT